MNFSIWTFLAFYINFECCTLETMCLIVLFKFFMQYPSYNVYDCPLFHHFHQLVLSLFLKTFLILPPTTVLCIFHEDSSMQQSMNFTIQLTRGSAGTQAIATFICTCKIKTLTLLSCYFTDVADVLCINKMWILSSSWQGVCWDPSHCYLYLHSQDKDPYFVVLLICWIFADMPHCIPWIQDSSVFARWFAVLSHSNFVHCWVCSAPEGRVCWRDCRVVPLAVWWPPEGYVVYWAIGCIPGPCGGLLNCILCTGQ